MIKCSVLKLLELVKDTICSLDQAAFYKLYATYYANCNKET